MKSRSLWHVALTLLLALAIASPVVGQAEGSVAPLLGQDEPGALTGRYIVVFKDGTGPGAVDAVMRGNAGQVLYRYSAALHGFAAALPEAAVQGILRNPLVAYVEADQQVWASGTQNGATWGLDRIDQRALPLNGAYSYNQTGSGVTAYIIDTGILYNHSEFGGRAVFSYDAFGGNGVDCHGHGTHVAGTVGGATYGVAKNVALRGVRVLDCDGYGSDASVIAGIDFVTAQKQALGGPMVANMSLGGGASTALDNAVKGSIAAGVSYAVAAGNGNFLGIAQDACKSSPARVAEAMTIGATNSSDTKASWSNYGNCVDWFAPGVSITSAWNTGNNATNTISGTSMATPHTAGVAALYLQANPTASPLAVRNALYDLTTKGIVASSNTTNNHLLYNQIGGATPNNPPVASFSYNCTELTCSFTDTSTDVGGSVVAWSWSFGGGGTSTVQNPAHTFAAGGTYNVTLVATDDDGATGNTQQSVTVSGASTGITLTARGYKVKSVKKVDLTWSGATTLNVDVYRNGVKLVTTSNDGFHTDSITSKGGGTFTYKVCQAGSTTACSSEVSVTF